jgi:aspartate aminotransferase
MLSEKAKHLTPSLTLGISTKVKELKAQGLSILDLSIGEPDFMTPQAAKNGGIYAIEHNKTKYDAAMGNLELRKAIVHKLKNENNLDYAAGDIVVTSGAKHAITNALMAITNPGDEVLVPVPYWVSYPEMVKLTGCTPVFVETTVANSFKLTLEDLKAAITPKTKAIFLTNPSNPTGVVYTKEELAPLVAYLVSQNIMILADEIYERICYLDTYTSVASLSKEAKEMTITINGTAKSLAMTGWRIGYTASTPEIATAMGSIQGHLVSHPSTISQHAALEAMKHCEPDIQEMVKVYRTRRDRALELISGISELSVVKPDGAFYVFINISSLSGKLPGESLSMALCDELLVKHQVAFVPGIAFGNDHFIRMSYATDLATIEEALTRLKTCVQGICGTIVG